MWLMVTLTCFLLAVAAHAILCRSRMQLDFVAKSLLAGAALGLVLAGSQLATHGFGMETAAALLLYAFLSELYIFGFTLVSSSVSVSLLLKLSQSALTSTEIENIYSNKSMVEGRFERLLRAGLLTRNGACYQITPKAKVLVAGFRTVRFFFRHNKAPSESHSS